MSETSLQALNPLDGRYARKTETVASYFSEFAYTKHRVEVEVEYVICLLSMAEPLPSLANVHVNDKLIERIRSIHSSFSIEDCMWIKKTETTGGAPGGPELGTNHDVKAVEYFVKHKLSELKYDELHDVREFVHFGLTSQDISNTAMPLMTKRFLFEEHLPNLLRIVKKLDMFGRAWKDEAMLAHTHGQPASPTILGKEIMLFATRLKAQIAQLVSIPHTAKFGGATGNLNAHFVAYPDLNWVRIFEDFLAKLGLKRLSHTTQIDNYDNAAALYHCLVRINTILIDFCRDIWTYVSMEVFTQKTVEGEIGSSAMPHKVNPIDFENAEGNLGLANALFEFLAGKLPISRLQRDLTDSTVLRNVGVPFGYTQVAVTSILKGLNKLVLNSPVLTKHLDSHWEVVAEALQTILRREGIHGAYEILKKETRGEVVTKKTIEHFISRLEKDSSFNLSKSVLQELRAVTPSNYVGRFDPGPSFEAWLEETLPDHSRSYIDSLGE